MPAGRLSLGPILLTQANRHLDATAASPAVSRYDSLSQQALDLLRSPRARKAFDIHQEPPAVRDRYGNNRFGQSVLLARRLVEAGVSLVQVNWTREAGGSDLNPVWDTHQKNTDRLKTALMPPMERNCRFGREGLDAWRR